MLCAFNPNCTDFPNNCQSGSQDANPDVAGIGVVWAFGITSLITILCAMPIMLVGVLDLILSHSAWLRSVSNLFPEENSSTAARSQKWLVDFIEHITLGLSDQQLVTGLAILITGYTKQCSMKSRHFWIVFDLAYFSSVTHLASLPALRYYFAKHHRFRDLRVFLMLSNYVLLLAAAVLTFRDYDERARDCPIRCTFNRIRTKRFGVSAVYTVQMVFLTLVFFWQLVMLYANPNAWNARHRIIVKPRRYNTAGGEVDAWGEYLEEQVDTSEGLPAGTSPSQISHKDRVLQQSSKHFHSRLHQFHKRHKDQKTYKCLQWAVIMVLSPPAPFVWLFIMSMWGLGVKRLLWDRQWAVGTENHWSFGQVLPLLLVVLPFFTVIEVFQEGKTPKMPKTQLLQRQTPSRGADGSCGLSG